MCGRISQDYFFNPILGDIQFDGYGWLAKPRSHFGVLPQHFASLKEAQNWIESLDTIK